MSGLLDAIYKCTPTIESMEKGACGVDAILAVFGKLAQFVGAAPDADARAGLSTWTRRFLDTVQMDNS
jgi:hypothetical protein